MLFYTARVGHMFRVHGQIPLNDLFVEERTDNPTQFSFSIYSQNRYDEMIAKISIADYVVFFFHTCVTVLICTTVCQHSACGLVASSCDCFRSN